MLSKNEIKLDLPLGVVSIYGFTNTLPVHYMVLNEDGKNVNREWLRCRDYVLEVLWKYLSGTKTDIYPLMSSNGWKKQDALRLVIGLSHVKREEYLSNILTFIHTIELEMAANDPSAELPLTIAVPVKGRPEVTYVQAAKRWMRHPAMASFYLLLYRIGYMYDGRPIMDYLKWLYVDKPNLPCGHFADSQDYQVSEAAFGNDVMRAIIESGGTIFAEKVAENWNPGIGRSSVHNYAGVNGLANGNNPCRLRKDSALEKMGWKRQNGKFVSEAKK
jgi:hypothetical protein